MRTLNIGSNLSDLFELHRLAAEDGSEYADSVYREAGWIKGTVPTGDEIEAFWGMYLDAADQLDGPAFDNADRAGEEYAEHFSRGFGARWQALG